jgi:hypothetical protein
MFKLLSFIQMFTDNNKFEAFDATYKLCCCINNKQEFHSSYSV